MTPQRFSALAAFGVTADTEGGFFIYAKNVNQYQMLELYHLFAIEDKFCCNG